VTRYASPRLRSYAALAASALAGALISGRPELVALAAPFLTFLAIGLTSAREPNVSTEVVAAAERGLEGDPIRLTFALSSPDAAADLELQLALPAEIALTDPPTNGAWRLRLDAGERRVLALQVRANRWGVHSLGAGRVRAMDPFSLFVWEWALAPAVQVRVYPRPERLRDSIAPRRTQLLAGNRIARRSGDGLEFAGIRPFVPGDRVRRVNWRATARRGVLHVNEQHPDRNADVILFLDTFEEARSGVAGTLDMALRAAASLAAAHLQLRDRVGIVSFGGVLHWLEPTLGGRAIYRIADALIQSEITFSFVWKTLDVIPPRLLPAGALVIGLTPLLDPRGTRALLDLRSRGYDLSIVECAAERFLAPPDSPQAELARRLWRLQRAALRTRLRGLGVSVAEWDPGESLSLPLGEVIQSRRHGWHHLPS